MAGYSQLPKQIKVMFDRVFEGFVDNNPLVNIGTIKKIGDKQEQQRSAGEWWERIPSIVPSYDGEDMTNYFQENTELLVPRTIDQIKNVPFKFGLLNGNDPSSIEMESRAAGEKLASDIEVAALDTLATWASTVIKTTTAPTGFADIALADTRFNSLGINWNDRKAILASSHYNNMAGNLASRETLNSPITAEAYRRALVGRTAGFDTFKLQYTKRIAAATSTTSVATVNASSLGYLIPQSWTAAIGGRKVPVDNRAMLLRITHDANKRPAVGDRFTAAGVNEVHLVTKMDTGQPKTFTVLQIVDATTSTTYTDVMVNALIPPVSAIPGGSTDEQKRAVEQYQNATAAIANNAPITWLNTKAGDMSFFFAGRDLEILPGLIEPLRDSGMYLAHAYTDEGLPLVMLRQADIKTGATMFRFTTNFGVCVPEPIMAGVWLFDQT